MPISPPDSTETIEAEPYGLLGLTIGSIAIVLLTVLFCGLAGAIVFGLASAILGWHEALAAVAALRPEEGADSRFLVRLGLVVSLVVYAALALAIIVVARFRAGSRWRDIIALHGWNPLRGRGLFWLLAVLGFVYNLGVSALISIYYPASKDWIETPSEPAWILAFVVLAAVFAPIAEELVFRGWLFTSLKRSFGVTATIIVTSLTFALAHWESTHLYALAVFPVGIVLGLIRQKSGTIVASMTFHAFYNGAASILLFLGK